MDSEALQFANIINNVVLDWLIGNAREAVEFYHGDQAQAALKLSQELGQLEINRVASVAADALIRLVQLSPPELPEGTGAVSSLCPTCNSPDPAVRVRAEPGGTMCQSEWHSGIVTPTRQWWSATVGVGISSAGALSFNLQCDSCGHWVGSWGAGSNGHKARVSLPRVLMALNSHRCGASSTREPGY